MAMRRSERGDTVSFIASVRNAAARCLDVLLPPQCLTCDSPVAEQGTLCLACWSGVQRVTAPMCQRCGVPFLHAGQGGALGLCPVCVAKPPAFATARAALRYDEGAKRLLLPFKHADRTELAAALAGRMAQVGAALLRDADIVAPVPLHWRRLAGRRYNQAALLAEELAQLAAKPHVPDLLERRHATPHLGERSAAERTALVRSAFRVRRTALAQLRNRRVLLVDDVMTSGATADACARVLLDGGAAHVDVLAAARVPDPRLEQGRKGTGSAT
jgi:ComF family protein